MFLKADFVEKILSFDYLFVKNVGQKTFQSKI